MNHWTVKNLRINYETSSTQSITEPLHYAADVCRTYPADELLPDDTIVVTENIWGKKTKRSKRETILSSKEIARFTGAEVLAQIKAMQPEFDARQAEYDRKLAGNLIGSLYREVHNALASLAVVAKLAQRVLE